jgi:hypothetical protein
LLLLLLMVLACLALAGCGGSGDSGAKELSKQEELKQARQQGASEQRIKQLEREIQGAQGNGGGTAIPSNGGGGGSAGRSSCGGGLSVGPNTSCAFADRVQRAFKASGPGPVEAYSPTTGRTYTMNCTGGSPHVCTGGNNASVYIP